MNYFGPNTSDDPEYAGAIQVGAKAGPDAEEARWTLALNIFFRFVALLWMAEGLEQWRRILLSDQSFLDVSSAMAVAVVFFAVLDLVAAVGLWMIAPWGGVVWLLTVMAQAYVSSIKPNFFLGGATMVKSADAVLLALYFFLSWRANRASGAQNGAIDDLLGWLRNRVKGAPRSR